MVFGRAVTYCWRKCKYSVVIGVITFRFIELSEFIELFNHIKIPYPAYWIYLQNNKIKTAPHTAWTAHARTPYSPKTIYAPSSLASCLSLPSHSPRRTTPILSPVFLPVFLCFRTWFALFTTLAMRPHVMTRMARNCPAMNLPPRISWTIVMSRTMITFLTRSFTTPCPQTDNAAAWGFLRSES